MIISQGMRKGQEPWQVSGMPCLTLRFPCHPFFRVRIRNDCRYTYSPSTGDHQGGSQKQKNRLLSDSMIKSSDVTKSLCDNLTQTFRYCCSAGNLMRLSNKLFQQFAVVLALWEKGICSQISQLHDLLFVQDKVELPIA